MDSLALAVGWPRDGTVALPGRSLRGQPIRRPARTSAQERLWPIAVRLLDRADAPLGQGGRGSGGSAGRGPAAALSPVVGALGDPGARAARGGQLERRAGP